MASQPSDEPSDPGSKSHSPLSDRTSHAEIGISETSGRVILGSNDATYVGATHWAAILDDIEEVKGYFSETGEETSLGDHDLSLLFNSTGSTATREDLLAALPEPNIVNRLVSRYFNSNSPAMHIIHKPTFQKNYKKFWADPSSSPISFIALIYSMMCLGIFAELGAGEENADVSSTPTETIQIYRRCCAQCLALSNYAEHPGTYTLETFLLYMECEFVLSKGDQMSCYLIGGVAVRLALRMGLHRDSENVQGNITPYQGEIRRRVWHLLVQMDLLVSFHNGLPSMVQAVKSDTQEPLNLLDQDFDEDSTELPPSRPETEITCMSYTLAKGRLARVFGKIIEQANLLTLPSYTEVTALDQELQQAFSATPPFLCVVPMDHCITDTAELVIRRFSLAVLFQKSRCILHRKYLMKQKENVDFSYSKKSAIDASRELLRMQSEVHDATQPGGLLYKDRWVISSLAMHDLLLAAVILYLCLIQESIDVSPTLRDQQTPNTHQTEIIEALEGSLHSIFQRHGLETDVCTGVDDAITLGRFGGGQFEGLGDAFPFPSPTIQSNIDFVSMPPDIIGEITDISMDFDWDFFDNHVRHTQINNQSWPDTPFHNFNSREENNSSP
ncbi:uncharacterized protein TRUGW13939_02794 [Talaromyces rugulosus]|uniref:Xylanolytic transcriptional activator regulatory domain-containing protein n=1 Tax=Talaromyces rugulosus TaxID=121627 RepID=A0A7H8QP06_TALRU|nr:uncharacterized protein TRUGW13939_02794 [Talaromyces rugulosus]QKX55697.1 hypothetical protein TRUGW13939_02794 [Talaromyces rugulosus]